MRTDHMSMPMSVKPTKPAYKGKGKGKGERGLV